MIRAADVDYAIDQKKRIAVRQQPADFFDVCDIKGFVAHYVPFGSAKDCELPAMTHTIAARHRVRLP